jgi:hypothetical protein
MILGDVGIGWLKAKGTEHGDDLAAMKSGMVHGVEYDLPTRYKQSSARGYDGRQFSG